MTLQQQFLKAFRPIMKSYGFRSKAGAFFKKSPEGWWKYSVLWHYRTIVDFIVEIRKELIEQIRDDCLPLRSGDIDLYIPRATVGYSSLIHIAHGWREEDLTMKVKGEAGLTHALAHAESIFRKVALPFFQKFDSIEAIDCGCNDGLETCQTPEAVWKVYESKSPCKYDNAEKGLITAKLLGRPDYKLLQEKYILGYKVHPYLTLEKWRTYKKLRVYLESDQFIAFIHQKRAQGDALLAKIDRIRQSKGLAPL